MSTTRWWTSPGSWRLCLAGFLSLGLMVVFGRPAPAATLAEGLRRQAPEIIKYLQAQDYQNVGVLKFRARKGNTVSDHIGTLNLSMARRLETALLFADDPGKPIGLIRDASEVAAHVPGADHLNPDSRQKLFSSEDYPLLWGGRKVTPDAFLTGLVVIRPDMRTMSVAICVFDRAGNFHLFDQFEADLDPKLLLESGATFRLRGIRGAGDDGQLKIEPGTGTVTALALQQQKVDAIREDLHERLDPRASKTLSNPLEEQSPVALDIFYDDQRIPYDIKNAEDAQIPEPREGQRVRLVLRKTDKANVHYGVVVKVNGESTLFHETKPPELCLKWILSNEDPTVTISGYNTDFKSREDFVIRSPSESKIAEQRYGKDCGQISMVVFREKTAQEVEAERKPNANSPPTDLPGGEPPAPVKPANTTPPSSTEPVPPPAESNAGKPETSDTGKTELAKVQDAREALATDLGLSVNLKDAESLKEAQQLGRAEAKRSEAQRTRGLTRGVIDSGKRSDNQLDKVDFQTDPIPALAVTVTYYHPGKR